jgi:peptidoglycan hydrolase-like protein with peptidoglycan-binding domain
VGGDSGGEEKAAAQLKSEAEAPDEIINRNLQSEERARQIQMALKKAGFYKGAIDGKVGPQTRKAIKAFQKAKGLMADGVVGPKTWEKLKEFLEERD